jgi:hypothetical protein
MHLSRQKINPQRRQKEKRSVVNGRERWQPGQTWRISVSGSPLFFIFTLFTSIESQ